MKERGWSGWKGRSIWRTAVSALMAIVILAGCAAQSAITNEDASGCAGGSLPSSETVSTQEGRGNRSTRSTPESGETAGDPEAGNVPISAYDGLPGYVEEDQESWRYYPEGVYQEQRQYPNGTQEDYRSLLALMTPGYEDMILADFNQKLLEWADEDFERAERIGGDVGYHDFAVSLTKEERFFVTVSANYSHMENAKMVQQHDTGREEDDPYVNQELFPKNLEEPGRGAYCSLWYQFSYHVKDRSRITVGERDRCLDGMTSAIRLFWNETGIKTLLTLGEAEIELILRQIADSFSTEQLTIHIESVDYDKNDEYWEIWDEQDDWDWSAQSDTRDEQDDWDWFTQLDSGVVDEASKEELLQNYLAAYDRLISYKTADYADKTVAEFQELLASDDERLFEAYAEVGMGGISPTDEYFNFLEITMRASLSELYGEIFHEPAFFSIELSKKGEPYWDPVEGDVLYEIYFLASVYLEYHIQNPETLTVGERDRVLTALHDELQSYVAGLSRAEIMEMDMNTELERKAEELIRRYSFEGMEISFEISCETFF